MTDSGATDPNNDMSNQGSDRCRKWKVVTGLIATVVALGIGGALVAPGYHDALHDIPAPLSISETVAPGIDPDYYEAEELAPVAGTDIDWVGADADEPPPVGSFRVRGDDLLIDGQAADVVDRAAAIWDRFVTLIPPEHRQMLVGFELMAMEYEGAHVYPTDADPSKWVLGVAEGLGSDLDMTLIHEWAHLVTLQAGEVPPNPNAVGCRTFFTGEGCALPHSTINQFVEAFWSQDSIDESDRIYAIQDVVDYYDALDAFLAERPGEFVTEYAATNPAEDLAETFAVFILHDRPTGNEIKDLKVLFLWDDPNLVTLRDQVRAKL